MNHASNRVGYGDYERMVYSIIVECSGCHAKAADLIIMPLCDFTNYTVSDFRNNPILRARIEDSYAKYITDLEESVIALWNRRV
mgnify:CR=1 FL=1